MVYMAFQALRIGMGWSTGLCVCKKCRFPWGLDYCLRVMQKVSLRILILFLFSLLAGTSAVDARPEHTIGCRAQDLVISTSDGHEITLASFRGRWVLLATGRSTMRSFQGLLVCFRHILKSLEGRPIEFIEVLRDPTFKDSELFSAMPPLGLRGLPACPLDLDFYGAGRFPEWYLIDPEGVVRAAGQNISSEALRRRLSEAWSDDPAFEGVNLEPSPDELILENSNHAYIDDKHEEGVQLVRDYLERHGTDEPAVRLAYYLELWTEGYRESLELLTERMKELEPSESMQLFYDMVQVRINSTRSTRDLVRSWFQRHPDSHYLKGIFLAHERLPESLTPSERALIANARESDLRNQLSIALAQAHLWEKNDFLAERLTHKNYNPANLNPLPRVLALVRLGREDLARSLLELPENLSPETANRTPVWIKMHLEAFLQNWEEASAYAARYSELRPRWIQGPLIGWMSSILLGDQKRAEAYKKDVLRIVETSKRYRFAATFLAENRFPTVDEIVEIKSPHIRFDTSLLAVLLLLETNGPQEALGLANHLQPAFVPGQWPTIIFHQLRWETLPKLSKTEN